MTIGVTIWLNAANNADYMDNLCSLIKLNEKISSKSIFIYYSKQIFDLEKNFKSIYMGLINKDGIAENKKEEEITNKHIDEDNIYHKLMDAIVFIDLDKKGLTDNPWIKWFTQFNPTPIEYISSYLIYPILLDLVEKSSSKESLIVFFKLQNIFTKVIFEDNKELQPQLLDIYNDAIIVSNDFDLQPYIIMKNPKSNCKLVLEKISDLYQFIFYAVVMNLDLNKNFDSEKLEYIFEEIMQIYLDPNLEDNESRLAKVTSTLKYPIASENMDKEEVDEEGINYNFEFFSLCMRELPCRILNTTSVLNSKKVVQEDLDWIDYGEEPKNEIFKLSKMIINKNENSKVPAIKKLGIYQEQKKQEIISFFEKDEELLDVMNDPGAAFGEILDLISSLQNYRLIDFFFKVYQRGLMDDRNVKNILDEILDLAKDTTVNEPEFIREFIIKIIKAIGRYNGNLVLFKDTIELLIPYSDAKKIQAILNKYNINKNNAMDSFEKNSSIKADQMDNFSREPSIADDKMDIFDEDLSEKEDKLDIFERYSDKDDKGDSEGYSSPGQDEINMGEDSSDEEKDWGKAEMNPGLK